MTFSMKKVGALLHKEIKDLFKNPNVLFMCALPILFSVMYTKLFGAVGGGMNSMDILILCVNMNLILISSIVISMLIAEEKEKNTLRTLLLSGLSPLEFLSGKVLVTFIISIAINVGMFFITGMDTQYLPIYILLTTLVVIGMIGIGAIIGLVAPNQMATGVIGMPILMFMLLIAMFARLSATMEKIAGILPNYNMNILLERAVYGGTAQGGSTYPTLVILLWIFLTWGAFIYAYNKIGLDK